MYRCLMTSEVVHNDRTDYQRLKRSLFNDLMVTRVDQLAECSFHNHEVASSMLAPVVSESSCLCGCLYIQQGRNSGVLSLREAAFTF